MDARTLQSSATAAHRQWGTGAAVSVGMSDASTARLSHELRTPLNGVLGLATLMLCDELSTIQRERLLTLRDAGQHLLAILDDVPGTWARPRRAVNAGVAPFRLAGIIHQVIAAFAQPAERKGLALRSQIDPRVGLVVGDGSQLRRMLLHLVDNAVAYTERGGVDVIAELVERTDDRCTVRLTVRDTGAGLDADIQRRLLTPDADDEPVPWAPGSGGLGLAICRQIVDRLEATLRVAAAPGEGSAISCTLDLGLAGHGVELDADHGDVPHPAPAGPSAASHATVLLVEDDDINQVVAHGMLEQLGYTVDIAADGIEAVEALRRRPYDAVLMDCEMPRLDGYATTAHVRATEPADRRTPIIAMTAAALDRDRRRCLDAGMDDYLSKPVTIDDLASALRRAGAEPSLVS